VRLTRTQLLAAAALIGAAAGAAHANGRSPATTGVQFTPGQTERILVPVTFGLMVSSDGGETFHWVCEAAIGYSGTFDPDYAVTTDGDIYASSQNGLRRSRDGGCTFETVAADVLGERPYLSEVELGPDGRLWVGTKNAGAPNDIYVSTDGDAFVSANLTEERIWWFSLRTTPADPMRLYVSGFRPVDREADVPPLAILRRSTDGGESWEELPVDSFEFGDEPQLLLLGVSPDDPAIVFARTTKVVDRVGDVLYRSADGGETWSEVARFREPISAFLIRPDGQKVIAATVRACPEDIDQDGADGGVPLHGCVRVSDDGGVSWRRAADQPRLGCVGERSDGMLFGCAANWSPDNFALGRSADGERWEQVYRFQDTLGPLECGAETEQARCAVSTWPMLCPMAEACPAAAPDAGPIDEPGDGGGGCCRVGDRTDVSWVPGLALVLLLLGKRRRRAG